MLSTISKAQRVRFQQTVWNYYATAGRHSLPWRQTSDPYHILVSELMLQQTQVDRVLPKYQAFIKRFPNPEVLAAAPLSAVLLLWQGLGYNRRAKYLHDAVKVVVARGGIWPQTEAGLRTLPGVGPYTAGALLAFAFGRGVPIIETNIRTVVLHHFFPKETAVDDAAVMSVVAETLPETNCKEWYYALMDYGVYLKKSVGNPSRRSKHHTTQGVFAGSNRQLRGALVRLIGHKDSTQKAVSAELSQFDPARVQEQLETLQAEGLIVKRGRKYHLAT